MLYNNKWKNIIGKKTILAIVVIVSIFVGFVVFFNVNTTMKSPNVDSGILKVYFIDVGDGDCTFVLLPNGENLLIDAGHKSDGKKISDFLNQNGISKLNYVLATHPDKDHIGGFETILNDFQADKIFAPDVSKKSKIFSDVTDIIQKKGLTLYRAFGGNNMYNNNGVTIDFLAPNSSLYKEINDYSAVIKVKYKNTSFLFMGDAGEESQEEILQRFDFSANVIKISHHGEASSTPQVLIDSVKPQYAVISAESKIDNPPYSKVVDRLKGSGVTTFLTGSVGNIVFTSDGQSITVN